MRLPKHWALVLLGVALAAILIGLVVHEPQRARVASAVFEAPALPPELVPAVPQPGGIDPLGASRAIRRALEDC